MRRVAVFFLLIIMNTSPLLAWDGVDDIIHGTARPLERGEMTVGIMSPLGYGLSDSVAVFSHPIVALLLSPNLFVRLNMHSNKSWALSLEGGYQQSFLSVQQGDSDYPGFIQSGLVFSMALVQKLQLNMAAGYESRFGAVSEDVSNAWYYRLGLDYLFGTSNLMMLRFSGIVNSEALSFETPTLVIVYAHEFGRMRLGVGAALGEFVFSTARDTQGAVSDSTSWPVFPWLDIWWRF